MTWPELDAALRERGVAVGGNYGTLSGRVFRIGHMGSQADCELVSEGMNILAQVITNHYALRSRQTQHV